MQLFSIFSILIFLGFGFLIKGIQSAGEIRKKFLFLSTGYIFICIFGALDGFTPPNLALIFIRIGMSGGLWFAYFGLREAPAKTKKIPSDKKVELKESKISLIETLSKSRPSQITEEEVSFSREKKICLMCKGKVLGLTYICPKCDALYCVKCSEALSNSENMCWVCNDPIDPSKPLKPYEEEEEEVEIEASKEPPEKTK